jgi:hypothetical protein
MVNFLKDQFKDFGTKSKVGKRLLHERSHMAVEFPQSNDRVLRTFIPFLENPQITERGQANLNSYQLVGRAGELFSYAGAKSRKLKLVFNISLLHVMEMDTKEGIADHFKRQFNLFFTDKGKAKTLFNLRKEAKEEAEAIRESIKSFGRNASVTEETRARLQDAEDEAAANDFLGESDQEIQDLQGFGRDYASNHRDHYRRLIGALTGAEIQQQESESFIAPLLQGEGISTTSDRINQLNKVIDLIYVWVNLIRATTLNHSMDTLLGPPIVRLTHGAMYDNVPCLVEDYDIKILDEAGYELETLTPKRIEVSLSLVENRAGNFGRYAAGKVVTGDNITGWESIITNNELDPMNGIIAQRGGNSDL